MWEGLISRRTKKMQSKEKCFATLFQVIGNRWSSQFTWSCYRERAHMSFISLGHSEHHPCKFHQGIGSLVPMSCHLRIPYRITGTKSNLQHVDKGNTGTPMLSGTVLEKPILKEVVQDTSRNLRHVPCQYLLNNILFNFIVHIIFK